MAETRVLVVEDESHLATGLQYNLEAEGFAVDVADDGLKGLQMAQTGRYALLVLDVMLPSLDGFQILEKLRAAGQRMPVLMLTAKDNSADVVRGLELGADDYLAKPFDLGELLARVRGLLRRVEWMTPAAADSDVPVSVEGLTLDYRALRLTVRGESIQLTPIEMNLLRVLVEAEDRPVPRGELLSRVWGLDSETNTRTVDAFIVRLRRYVEPDPANPRRLISVRGVGYAFVRGDGEKT